MCVDKQTNNKNCLITDIACPSDKRVAIKQEINNKHSQQDLVFLFRMKIVLVEDEGGKICPYYFGALTEKHNAGIKLVLHCKEQSCRDQQGSSKVTLKFKVACCHPIMRLKFQALTYLP